MIQVTFYSKHFGVMETQAYANIREAKRQASKRLRSEAHYDSYTIFQDGKPVHSDSFGFSKRHILLDFKAYCKCCREAIGAWELFPESFRFFVDNGYIVPVSEYLTLECGRYELTPRFREVGLAIRNGGLPPEFEAPVKAKAAAA